MSEGAIKNAVMKRLGKEPHSVVRKLHGNPFAVAGDPDILFIRRAMVDAGVREVLTEKPHLVPGVQIFAIELKAPGEDATPIQKNRLADWRDAGATAFVAHSLAEVLAGVGLT